MSSRRKRLRQRERRIGHAEATATGDIRARWATATRTDRRLLRQAIRDDWNTPAENEAAIVHGLCDAITRPDCATHTFLDVATFFLKVERDNLQRHLLAIRAKSERQAVSAVADAEPAIVFVDDWRHDPEFEQWKADNRSPVS